ncbi:MAG: CAP domain-containing protein [Solirubrobacterales bacterium]
MLRGKAGMIRLWTVLAVVAGMGAASAAMALGPGLASASAACPHADAHAHEIPLPKLRKTVTCLVNQKRAKHDRGALEPNAKLGVAAQDHNDVMLAKECFRHRCPGEPGLGHRVKRSGYTKPHGGLLRFAEDLGFAETPRRMIKLWLHSRFNRRNLLDAGFRDIGVGVGWGAPKRNLGDSDFATYTIVFGLRRR